jgi:hypothetical protein
MRSALRLFLLAATAAGAVAIPAARAADAGLTVSLVKMPYRGERNLPDLSDSPDYLEAGGIAKLVEQQGCRLRPVATVALSPEEKKAYGEWNRLGLANGQLARIIASWSWPPRSPRCSEAPRRRRSAWPRRRRATRTATGSRDRPRTT